MIKRHYSPNSRRALNVIWNAAGRYDFEPDFLAFKTNGASDFYFNIIIGLAEKWLDMNKISDFFDSFSYAVESAEYSEYVWLGLESCLYNKELQERPMLSNLRKQHAEEFFLALQQLSKQQMEVMSMGVYTQQQARWALVTGRRLPNMSAKEKGMFEALKLSGELQTDELIMKLRELLETYCRFEFNEEKYRESHKTGLIKRLWGRHVQAQYKNCDSLIIRSGTGTGDPKDAVHLNQLTGFKKDTGKEALDRAYIEGCFGPCIYTKEELKRTEAGLCVKEDAGCKLWFADSEGGQNKKQETRETKEAKEKGREDKEISYVHKSIEEQKKRNLLYLEKNSLQIRESIKKLSAELEVLMNTFLKHLPEKADSGRIDSGRAYRIALFNDTKIFIRDGDEAENNICVDILLDASQSRMNSQELIASEAYVLAESMLKAGVKVQVLSFRSLRGYTVIERLKAFSEKDAKGVFGYFASGWNRDALAIKAVGYMIGEELIKNSGEKHILLVLTDASPNDSTPLGPSGTRTKAQNYEGIIPTEAAEAAVKELKSRQIHTAAVFHGATIHLENVYRIYGKEYIRIRSIAQLASGFIDLMQSSLQEMEAE